MPRDSSLFAYRSLVTSTGGNTVTFLRWGTEPSAGCIPTTAAPASERTATSLMIFTLTSLPLASRGGAAGAFPVWGALGGPILPQRGQVRNRTFGRERRPGRDRGPRSAGPDRRTVEAEPVEVVPGILSQGQARQDLPDQRAELEPVPAEARPNDHRTHPVDDEVLVRGHCVEAGLRPKRLGIHCGEPQL